MDLRLVVGVLVVAVVVGMFTGFIPAAFSYFSAHPFVFFALVSVGVMVAAIVSGQQEVALVAVGVALVSMSYDQVAPAYSETCTAVSPVEARAFIQQYPQQALAVDTLVCNSWLSLTGDFNPVLLNFDFDGMSQLSLVQVVSVVLIVVFGALAVLVSERFWTEVVLVLAFLLMGTTLITNAPLGVVSVTLLLLIAYVIFPAIIFVLGSYLISFGIFKE